MMQLNQNKKLSSNPIPRAWSNHKSIILSIIGLQQLSVPSGVLIGSRDSNSSDNFIWASRSSIKTGWDDRSSGCFYLTKFRETSDSTLPNLNKCFDNIKQCYSLSCPKTKRTRHYKLLINKYSSYLK
jgi:hypothetical protein